MADISDSIYKEAVTKLKILLSATEPNMNHAEDSFDEQLAGKKYAISKSLNHIHEFDKSEGERNIGTRQRDPQFAKLPPRQPNSSVRR